MRWETCKNNTVAVIE